MGRRPPAGKRQLVAGCSGQKPSQTAVQPPSTTNSDPVT
jgi:hypothetical protein